MSFSKFGLSDELLRAVADAGYVEPTPIQLEAIPAILDRRDVLGLAQTGTGKTASFTLPMLETLSRGRARARMPRSLVLEPTRELASQVSENFDKYGKYSKLSKALLIGGVAYGDQEKSLDRGVDVLIATPGRLLDHFERGHILLTDVHILVIDEADRMLDMGFIPNIERIVGLLSGHRQTLLFSATMAPEIMRLADQFLVDAKEIVVAPPSSPSASIAQHVIMVRANDKHEALHRIIIKEDIRNAIIFCNRKRDIGALYGSLHKRSFSVQVLHGDLPQSVRTETLENFRKGEVMFLIASDVAARGLDIADLSHVFNFDVPINAEDYIHRIGRTGRAGKVGRAFMFVTPDDARALQAIEKLIGGQISAMKIEDMEEASSGIGEEAIKSRRRSNASSSAKGKTVTVDIAKVEREYEAVRPVAGVILSEGRVIGRSNKNAKRWENKHNGLRKQSQCDQQDAGEESTVKGLGDHVPAFLLRCATMPAKQV